MREKTLFEFVFFIRSYIFFFFFFSLMSAVIACLLGVETDLETDS